MSYVDTIGGGGSGSGTVSGPTGAGSSTDNAVVRWDGTTGTLIQNSNAILTDAGQLTLNNASGNTLSLVATTLSASGSAVIDVAEFTFPTGANTQTYGLQMYGIGTGTATGKNLYMIRADISSTGAGGAAGSATGISTNVHSSITATGFDSGNGTTGGEFLATLASLTTGRGMAVKGQAVRGNYNYGGQFTAGDAKGSNSRSIGVIGQASTTGATNRIGGLFFLDASNAFPSFDLAPAYSAALACDNGTDTSDIFVAKDNGTAVVTIADGGTVTLTGTLVVQNFRSKTLTIDSPGAAENVPFFYTKNAITVNELAVALDGSASPSVTWTLRFSTNFNTTIAGGTEVVTGGTTTTSTTGSQISSFNAASIPAGSYVRFLTTAQSGTVDRIHLTVTT